MNKRLAGFVLAGALIMGVTASCTDKDASNADLDEPTASGDVQAKHYAAKSPDSITVYLNVNDHPTIAKLCIEGLAFRTVSEKYVTLNTPAVERVPEWDDSCKDAEK